MNASVHARRFTRFAAALLLLGGMAAQPAAQETMTYSGPCDASAAPALDADHFVVANDERNTLGIYRRGQAQSAGSVNLDRFLGTDAESDIEGAAAIGQRVYWITSHARDSKGKAHDSRHRFFATELRPGSPPSVTPVHKPYLTLLDDMLASDALKPYNLAAAARLAAEAEDGFNIEGLAATPDGRLLIGLRNPLHQGRAILIPLENPAQVIDAGKRARLGAPIELDLGQRGIRSIELVGDAYLLVAGPTADRGSFALYRWSGRAGDVATPVAGVALGALRPEALFALPGAGRVQLLSDDGGLQVGGAECKKLPASRQTFRSLTVAP